MRPNNHFDPTFAHDYTVDLHAELPGSGQVLEFPKECPSRPASLVVRIEPTGRQAWFGRFRGGGMTHAGVTGAYSWPDPRMVCVACVGSVYLVDVGAPLNAQELDSGMVVDIRPAPHERLILLADTWEVRAYSSDGIAWRTGRIAVDGMRLADIVDGTLDGFARSADDDDEEVPFRIDMTTGRVDGGLVVR